MMIAALGRGRHKAFKRVMDAALEATHRLKSRPSRRNAWFALGLLVCAAAPDNLAASEPFRNGAAAFARHDYMKASAIFFNLAVLGDARAQTYLGYMYEYGKGVPQDFVVSAGWYRCASQQGFASAQYFLGLMYDKGRGVPQNYILAYALLNLAVAGAGPERDHWVIIRDAVLSKMSLAERNQAQQLSFAGVPQEPCLPMVTGF